MNNKYINFYNNLVSLTRNKTIYKEFTKQDTFSDRLVLLLFHFAFFLSIFKSNVSKNTLQEIFDYFFKQLELSIREKGFGDASINKKMKLYVNIFYSILNKIEKWHIMAKLEKNKVLSEYIDLDENSLLLSKYFDSYIKYLKKNTLNSLLKGVIKLNF